MKAPRFKLNNKLKMYKFRKASYVTTYNLFLECDWTTLCACDKVNKACDTCRDPTFLQCKCILELHSF